MKRTIDRRGVPVENPIPGEKTWTVISCNRCPGSERGSDEKRLVGIMRTGGWRVDPDGFALCPECLKEEDR